MTLRNIWLIGTLLVAAIGIGWLFTAKAHAGSCTTNTPLSLTDQGNGANYLGGLHDNGVVGQIHGADHSNNGTANLTGTAACPDAKDNTSDLLAIGAALSTPIWLEAGEKFAISGGLGFTDDATAVGATGVYRLDKNWSGFAGGAVSTDDRDMWAGKAGFRAGF
jgi:hypothetical protein